jgi:hypothetical protein
MVEDFDAHQVQPQPQVPPPPKPKSNTLLIVLIIVAVILLCCCASVVVLWNFGDSLIDWLEVFAFRGVAPLLM